MSFLEMKNVSLGFGPYDNRTEVLKDINLSVKENEFVAIIGFSGAGKSTLISLLAGLTQPDKGQVTIGGKVIKEPSPRLGIMFQNYSLLPWLTVYENIELAVRQALPKLKGKELVEHVERYVGMVSLTPALKKTPAELSGGMRQRASLARTLAMQPEVLLLDEPLSALDALTRANIQDEIIRIWENDKRTVVMITNDVEEALFMADRIIPLTIGPEATLADPFLVEIDRPRNRAEVNNNDTYKKLKLDVTNYLIGLNDETKKSKAKIEIEMPDVQPLDLSKPLSKNVQV